ncbi:uncharacterized protein UV8b_07348 [Ustilaginoidea virens]|uniref:Glutathione S-transferase n=1 Tax=Ustilaginoidea virens TaxID=1159556 RepID=A0A8E5MKX0_USTVR|nr:uncharacterized protein UV8b_07348 [Ustilaginoidea virens]QUC23107.1 hypothetical protein UV8b_07348 [Ustilaginoidea virens]
MPDENIVLYHYAYSPYARRIVWYLTLRGIPYAECVQPPMMPRPDIARLGIEHRRIPILSIGRDVYLDSRLQLQKLENLSTSAPRLGARGADQRAVERLLCSLMTDAGVFAWAAALLPADLPLLQDPAFQRDREDYFGDVRTAEADARVQPVALRELASVFKLLETTLLADNRDWVLNTERPGLADIEAVWPLHWMAGIPGALPRESFSPSAYPKVYAWMERFRGAVRAAGRRLGTPRRLSGQEAARLIVGSAYHEAEGAVDATDFEVASLRLVKGDRVTVGPTDFGSGRRDVATLVGIDDEQVVFETKGEDGTVRVHAPRHGFRLGKAEARL